MSSLVTVRDLHGGSFKIDKSLLVRRISAYGIVIVDDKLLVSPQFDEKMYDLPGGGLDEDETPEVAVVREVKEETGLDVEVVKKIGESQSYFYPKHNKKNPKAYDNTLLYFLCNFVGGEISTDGFDEFEMQYARAAEWLPLDCLDTIKVASTVDYRPFVKEALKEPKL